VSSLPMLPTLNGVELVVKCESVARAITEGCCPKSDSLTEDQAADTLGLNGASAQGLSFGVSYPKHIK
jgi:hypothetical protein